MFQPSTFTARGTCKRYWVEKMAKENQHITIAAEKLKAIRKAIVTSHLEAADIVASAIGRASISDAESLLASTGAIEIEAVRLYIYLVTLPEGVKDFLRSSALSLETVKALASADPEVQDKAYWYLRHNQSLGVEDLEQLIKRHRRDILEPNERIEKDRSDLLNSHTASKITAIENDVAELRDMVREFSGAWDADPEQWDDGVPFEYRPEYSESFNALSSHARRILRELNGLLDAAHLEADLTDEARKLRQAVDALQRLADGVFAHSGGFGFEVSQNGYVSRDLYNALAYLAPSEARTVTSQPRKSLKVLELFAGAGGSSIGLMSAGYEHVALIEKSGDRVKTLRKNWPSWNVVKADIHEYTKSLLQRHRGIDLISAGLPCAPGDEKQNKPDLFPAVLDALEGVSPRSFMLHYDVGQRQSASELELAKVIRLLSKDGEYRLFHFILDTQNFGLPHARDHQFIVGIRSDVLGVFPNPKSLKPVSGTILEVLGPLVMRDRQPFRTDDREDPRKIFKHWADDWETERKAHEAPTLLPTLLTKELSTEAWRKAGFDASEVRDRLPTIGDPDIADKKFVPFLTTEVLAVAQGFPSEWQFLAEKYGTLAMIAEALPPVMAKVVGLAITSVLRGEPVDLIGAIKEPVINPARVGLGKFKLNLNQSRHRWPLEHTKGHPWIQVQAQRVLDGELIWLVEPNHMLRAPIRAEMKKVQAEWDFHISTEFDEDEELHDHFDP
jgi:site-specific DNA-cytosine methylase